MSKQDKVLQIPTPLSSAVAEIKDPGVRSVCQNFLQNFDLRNIQSFKELQWGYQGLLHLSAALGNQSEAVRSNLNLMTRILDSYSRVLKTYLETEFPRDLKAALINIFDQLQGKLSEEDLGKIKDIIDGI